MSRHYLMSSAGIAALLMYTPAHAQTEAPASNTAPQATTTATPTDSDQGIRDIVITAERRSNTTQRTPATIAVLSGDELRDRGVSTIDDALSHVSGVFVQANNKGANINIRGVGTSLDSAAGDPGVNTNIDGVYIRQASAVVGGLYDLDRIEVLKGPQGTLYGRNATGGVANILTADPGREFGYRGQVTVGDYSLVRTDAAINVPLSDTFAMRAAFGSESHTGYYDTGQDDAKRFGGRLKLLWTPSSAVRILVGGSYAHDGGVGPGSIAASEPEGSRHADDGGVRGQLNQKFVTAFSTVQVDTGPVVVTFIPTFSNYTFDSSGKSYGFVNSQRVRERQLTSELRLSSPAASPVQWVAGLYYYNTNLANLAILTNQGIVNDQPELKTESYAAFADATVPITKGLRLIGGARYTKDHKTQRNTFVSSPTSSSGPFDGVLDSDAVNFRVGAQYDLAPSALLYATFSTGYKAGGFTPDEPGFNTFKPERLRAVEAGVKSRLFGNKLQLNLSGFHYSYDNYQVSSLGFAHYGGLSALVFNSQGKTEVYGLELQASYRPTRDDQFDLTLSPLHSRFGRFIIPATTIPGPGGPIVVAPEIDVSGKEVPSAPGLSGTASYEHNFRFGGGRLAARADTFFSTSYWSEFSHAAFSRRPGYAKTDLSLTFFGKNDAWSVGAFVKNVENSWIVTLKANTPTGGDFALQPPRTFGFTFSLRQ